ncbi:WD40-repeat-containing domain protein [Mucidula mucida]|nr:WD40-repeat-containing domain protein [Mucidula mucida]
MAQSLVPSAQFSTHPAPSSTTRLPTDAYVLALAALPGHYAAASSSPSNTIEIYDKTSMRHIQSLPGHDTATSSLKSVDAIAGFARQSLISSGHDGSVKVWDDRSNSHSIKMTNLGKHIPLLCCDVSHDGLTVVAGSDLQGDDASIFFWDPRQPATPLRTHASTHSDDITVLHFGPENTLLSASSDGLISLSNGNEDDEDEAVVTVANWGCSVAQAGWMPGYQRIWAASDMETFGTWTSNLDLLQSVDIRGPSLHGNGTWVTDYFVSSANLPGNQPAIFAGSNEGDFALLSIPDSGSPWYIHNIWSHGHVGVVRSLLWDKENGVLISGGEDSKINTWLPSTEPEDVEMMQVDSPPRKRDMDWDDDREVRLHIWQ